MIILGYVGNHAQDSLAVRLGWAATRLVQRGQFARVTHVEGYDTRGALATVFLSGQDADRWFCNEIVGASVGLVSPDIFGPAQFMALALSMPGARLVPVPQP